MFSEAFRERLRRDDRIRWAADLTEDELAAIFWMVAEFGLRAPSVLPLLEGLWRREPDCRAVAALESLYRVVAGDRPNREQYIQRVSEVLAEVRGHEEALGGMPGHRWAVEWQGRRVGWISPPAIDASGDCFGKWWPAEGATDFLAQVAASASGGVYVVLGGMLAMVISPPDDAGRMTFFPLFYLGWHTASKSAPDPGYDGETQRS